MCGMYTTSVRSIGNEMNVFMLRFCVSEFREVCMYISMCVCVKYVCITKKKIMYTVVPKIYMLRGSESIIACVFKSTSV